MKSHRKANALMPELGRIATQKPNIRPGSAHSPAGFRQAIVRRPDSCFSIAGLGAEIVVTSQPSGTMRIEIL
jgi:hypothetical protein